MHVCMTQRMYVRACTHTRVQVCVRMCICAHVYIQAPEESDECRHEVFEVSVVVDERAGLNIIKQ